MSEFQLISQIKKILKSNIIGDDTAPIKIGNKMLVVTNDILLEGQHFLDYFPSGDLGWKAISVNVSDIVTSGGKPKYALVSLLLPKNETDLVKTIYQSIKKACQYYHCYVIGGNITRSEKLGIDIFMIGETKKFVSRRNARPRDFVYLTGAVGDSKAGLELLMMKKNRYEAFERKLIEKHLKPIIRINLSQYISQNSTASVDISDGLSSDLLHVANMSDVRIDIDSKKIPISKELKMFGRKYKKNPLEYGLIGGEDYHVLFTSPKSNIKNPNIYLIGSVAPGSGVYLDGKKIKNESFDHFSSS